MSEVVPFVPARAPFSLVLTLDQTAAQSDHAAPGWLTDIDGKPLLTTLLARLSKSCEPTRLVVVANRRHSAFGSQMIAAVMGAALPATTYRWVDTTAGPAASVMLGIAALRSEEAELPLFMLEPIALLDGRDLGAAAARLKAGIAAWVDAFPSDHPEHEQVSLGETGLVSGLFRQPPLTGIAASGLFGFPSAATYRAHFARTAWTGTSLQVPDVINTIIARGGQVQADPGRSSMNRDTLPLAVPARGGPMIGGRHP